MSSQELPTACEANGIHSHFNNVKSSAYKYAKYKFYMFTQAANKLQLEKRD